MHLAHSLSGHLLHLIQPHNSNTRMHNTWQSCSGRLVSGPSWCCRGDNLLHCTPRGTNVHSLWKDTPAKRETLQFTGKLLMRDHCLLPPLPPYPDLFVHLFFFFFFFSLFSTSLSLAEKSGHNSHKSSTTLSYQWVQHFPVSKQWYGHQCLGFLTCAQMLMHVIANCTQDLYRLRKSVCTGNWLGEKSLPALKTWTCISITAGFSVRHSTNWVILAPGPVSLQMTKKTEVGSWSVTGQFCSYDSSAVQWEKQLLQYFCVVLLCLSPSVCKQQQDHSGPATCHEG